jgi:processive 1,2-diacylglycerol beta-glucosyltransferase
VANQLRILVLTSSTGGGHDARAQAFAEWCFMRYRHGVDVRIEQMLEKSSVVSRSGVNLYNWIQLHVPMLHKLFYAVVELLSFLNRSSVTLGRKFYREVVLGYRPHLILSVHDCLNRGYFPYARKLLGADQVKCATYCGEFSGGWGYSRNWIEPSVDLYVSRTATAREYALKLGIPPERAIVRGHLMRPRSAETIFSPERRRTYRRERLALMPDRFTVFLATGGNGAHNHFVMLSELLRHSANLQVIAICGRNKQAYNELVHWRAQHPDLPMYIEGYTDVMHELMQVSDLIVTRGGTTTCAKALHFGCPIVFNAFGGIMPQESLTWKFFRNGAGTPKIENGDDFAALIDDWILHPRNYESYRDAFLAQRYQDDQAALIEDLIQLAEQAAGITVVRHE